MSFQAVGPEVPKERWAVWEPVEFNDNESPNFFPNVVLKDRQKDRLVLSKKHLKLEAETVRIMSFGDGYNILLFKLSSIIRNDFMESTSQ